MLHLMTKELLKLIANYNLYHFSNKSMSNHYNFYRMPTYQSFFFNLEKKINTNTY